MTKRVEPGSNFKKMDTIGKELTNGCFLDLPFKGVKKGEFKGKSKKYDYCKRNGSISSLNDVCWTNWSLD